MLDRIKLRENLTELGIIKYTMEKLEKRRDEILLAVTENLSVYKKNDIVDVHGYTHRGKKCSIEKINVTDELKLKIGAKVLKNNGKAPTRFRVFWESDEDPLARKHIENVIQNL